MFKPESWQSHNEYRTIVATIGHRLSRNNPKYSFNEYDEERQKLLNLNLDPLLDYIPAFYSKGGRPAAHQAQILRSLILFVLLFNQSPYKPYFMGAASPSQIHFPGCPYWLRLSGRTAAPRLLL